MNIAEMNVLPSLTLGTLFSWDSGIFELQTLSLRYLPIAQQDQTSLTFSVARQQPFLHKSPAAGQLQVSC